MVNCSLKFRIDTKNCIKCTHNLIFSCSAVCWNLNLDFPFQGGFCPHTFSTSSQGRGSEASTLHSLWANFKTNSLPMSYMQGQYHLSREQGKEKSPNFSPQSSTCQPAGGHGEHWNLPWSHGNKLPVWFPSSQCCTTAVQFSFFLTKFSVEEPVKQLVELSSTNWYQFLYGCDICKRTMLQVTINQVITKYLSIKNANLYKNIHRDTTTKSVAAHDI